MNCSSTRRVLSVEPYWRAILTNPELPTITVADFVAARLAESEKTQRQISQEAGFDHANVITMLKNGTTKIPLNRIGAFARALEVDPAHLLRLAMAEYLPDTWRCIQPILEGSILTPNECELVKQFRAATNNSDPKPVAIASNPGRMITLVIV